MKVFQSLAAVILIGLTAPGSFIGAGPLPQASSNAAGSSAAAKPATLPKDVYPDSYARVPLAKRDTLNDAEKKIYDELDAVDAKGGVGLRGPSGILFHSPGLSEAMPTNNFLRKTAIGGAEYEIATLVTAREFDAQVMWTAHEPEALEKGVSKETIDVIRFRKPVTNLPERDAMIIQFVREMFGKGVVRSYTFAKAEKMFGRQQLVNLTAVVAYRAGVGVFSKAYDQRLNPNRKPLLPIP